MRGLGELQGKLVLDTSVVLEYIIARSRFRSLVEKLFMEVKTGRVELYVSTITLSEVFYVASRIYRATGVPSPNEEAERFTLWVQSRANVVDLDTEIALVGAEYKKKLGIALPDCIVIATAWRVGGRAVFKRVEHEMKPFIDELKRMGVFFLEDIVL